MPPGRRHLPHTLGIERRFKPQEVCLPLHNGSLVGAFEAVTRRQVPFDAMNCAFGAVAIHLDRTDSPLSRRESIEGARACSRVVGVLTVPAFAQSIADVDRSALPGGAPFAGEGTA